MSKRDINVYKEMLAYINPSSLNYQDWINVGMALKSEGCPLDWWDEWSAQEPRYKIGECFQKWKSFEGNGVTGGTLQYLAELNGWTPSYDGKRYKISGTGINADGSLEFDAIIHMEEDDSVIDKSWVEEESFKEPRLDEWKPIDELITYLETLFDPSDYVGYVMQSRLVGEGEKEKFIPYNSGVYHKTAGELIGDLRKYHDIGKALGDYDALGGAWIRFNPLDGQGIKNANVTYFRYALVECDNMSLGMQVSLMKELKLPIACLVYSGGKSIHAIVKIDAVTYEDYQKKVKYLYDVCQKNGITIDTQNKNPSRLSRMPGVIRGKHKQFLLETNVGCSSFEEWYEYIESKQTILPDPVCVGEYWDNRPVQDEEIIEGILRKGRKMVIAGPSKIGKTTLSTQLALAIANGWDWLGIHCKQGRVLYLNFEVAEPTFNEKLEGICQKKNVDIREVGKNLDVLHLRGFDFKNPDQLTRDIITKFRESNYSIMFIDPIYKIMDGDENSSEANRNMTTRFDRIARNCNCSIVYVHHFSKGAQGNKATLDRMSGHSTQGRDTDAGVSIMELDSPYENKRAIRVEFELRDFKDPGCINAWFEFPIHIVDEVGELDYAKLKEDSKGKKDRYSDFVGLLEVGFERNKYWNEDKKRFEAKQPDVIEYLYNAKKSNAKLDNFSKQFSKDFTFCINNNRTSLRRKEQKAFEKSIIYRIKTDPQDDYYY